LIFAVVFVISAVSLNAQNFGEWSPAASVESVPGTDPSFNTQFQDGCPAPARSHLVIYMASNRPGGQGGLDIWVSTRESTDDPWGPPSNLGAPINTAADEFCPTPIQNDRQLLLSVRSLEAVAAPTSMYRAGFRGRGGRRHRTWVVR